MMVHDSSYDKKDYLVLNECSRCQKLALLVMNCLEAQPKDDET